MSFEAFSDRSDFDGLIGSWNFKDLTESMRFIDRAVD